MPCRPEGAHCPGPSDDLTVAMRPGSLPRGCAALLPQYARAVVNSLPLHTKTQPPRVNGLHYGFLLSLELKRVLPIHLNAKKKTQQWRILPPSNCISNVVKQIKLMCKVLHVDLMRGIFVISQEAR